MDDSWWGWEFYGGSPLSRRLAKYGLIVAPRRAAPSNALLEWREEIAREAAAEEAWARQCAADVNARRERERHEELAALVARFGPDVVEALSRRHDPTFTLPDELRAGGKTKQRKRQGDDQ